MKKVDVRYLANPLSTREGRIEGLLASVKRERRCCCCRCCCCCCCCRRRPEQQIARRRPAAAAEKPGVSPPPAEEKKGKTREKREKKYFPSLLSFSHISAFVIKLKFTTTTTTSGRAAQAKGDFFLFSTPLCRHLQSEIWRNACCCPGHKCQTRHFIHVSPFFPFPLSVQGKSNLARGEEGGRSLGCGMSGKRRGKKIRI